MHATRHASRNIEAERRLPEIMLMPRPHKREPAMGSFLDWGPFAGPVYKGAVLY